MTTGASAASGKMWLTDFLDGPEIRHLHREYQEKVGDASNSVGEGERGKRDPTSASEDDPKPRPLRAAI